MILAKGISNQTKGVIVEDTVLPSTKGLMSHFYVRFSNQIK